MRCAIAAFLVAVMPGLAWASPLDQFSKILYFGDSFSDGGAAFALTNGTEVPASIYPNGQLTNGDVWTTQLGGMYVDGTYALDTSGNLTFGTGLATTNFAVGGAEAIAEPGDRSPDLSVQIAAYLASGLDLGPNSLAFIQIGFNDLTDISQVTPPSGATPEQIRELLFNTALAIGAEVTDAISLGVTALTRSGVSKVAVFGLPDLGIFPSVIGDGLSALASEFTPDYNDALKKAIESQFTPQEAMFIDTAAIFDDILANAESLGITKPVSQPCVVDFAQIQTCIDSNPNSYFFFDTVHPTEVVHTAFAKAAEDQFAPVPLPASVGLLLSGLFGLIILRRKSAAA